MNQSVKIRSAMKLPRVTTPFTVVLNRWQTKKVKTMSSTKIDPYMLTATFIVAGLMLFATAHAAERLSPSIAPIYSDLHDKPIRGYDPVAYFTEGKPVPGNEAFTHEWKGAKWMFSSAEHRDMFAADPEKYAPQYGGYCAYAASVGWAETIDPTKWTIHEGKLYLNDTSAYERWRKDYLNYIAKADKNWRELVLEAKGGN